MDALRQITWNERTMVEKVAMTDEEIVKLKLEWYGRGYAQAVRELRDALCSLLRLDERYAQKDNP